ncbi:hypothetical protein ACGFIV_10540 [Sphaerisporangium sp. NPDC049003]|uniref:hypothetical protein n=1 Tax=Sphaerisporangium sp. NPDC049003 TaxID=3364517 RepID=UPI00372401CF
MLHEALQAELAGRYARPPGGIRQCRPRDWRGALILQHTDASDDDEVIEATVMAAFS